MGDARNDRLAELAALGQSVWLDYISRSLIAGGGLQRLIDQDGIAGMTSNPSIFEKAIGGGGEYSDEILALARQGHDGPQIFDRLAVADVQAACDVFMPVYVGSSGEDGFVSLEVSPTLARDTERTISEARRLFAAVDRPNVMIKIPGTVEGLPAIRACLAAGLNINITLMFSMAHYEAVVEAFMSGLEDRLAAGGTVRGVASVASFFVSRVDTLVDTMLDERLAQAGDGDRERIEACKGKLAVANSKLVYERFQQLFATPRWQRLAAAGAKVQRVLWASTSTKNPAYSDTLYVDELIGPHTVNTLPEATLAAFKDHGAPRRTVDQGYDAARALLDELASVGIDVGAVTERLQVEGVALFMKAFDAVLAIVERRRRELLAGAGE
jgi:transaldolase / glucose-6-phosphate isomerase